MELINMEDKKVAVTTLGCRSNQYDSSAMEDFVREAGYEVASFSDRLNRVTATAGTYIINTCTVTHKTDGEGRQLVRRIRRMHPDSVIIVTGCYAQVSPEEVSAIEGVDYVLGNPEKDRIVECIKKGRQTGGALTIVGDYLQGAPLKLRARSHRGRTRVNLKVQDGCNKSCAFCVIPLARGASKSVPVADVMTEIKTLVDAGFKEMVLTGIHLGAYGVDFEGGYTILRLLQDIEVRDFSARFRISSLDPDEVGTEMIEFLSQAKTICNYLHLPLQSGDDKILRAMNRPYTAGAFADTVKKLCAAVPDISVGTDVIVGFPGEGDEEFENTFSLLEALPISYMHIFPYSKRAKTTAIDMAGHNEPNIIKERAARLRTLDDVKRKTFYERFLGQDVVVLIESARDRKTKLLKGRTSNYIPVLVDGSDELKTKEVTVRLVEVLKDGMMGQL
jgi:threonylcarbamoyladenosine tRNA methylthiotransferase MtaB